jgi:uncharacterized protein
MRRPRCAALWPLALAALLHHACAQSSATGTATDAPNAHSNGSYLHSYLIEPKPETPCPPGIDPIYQADVIVTGTDMRQRPWGFAQTFRTVLVKSSGDPRLMDAPRTDELAAKADSFVVCFNYVDMMAGTPIHDEQGTYDRPHKLTVTFDPSKIDAILAEFGDKPWRGERPVVVPVLLIHGRKPPPYVLNADNPAGTDQRASFQTWAASAGFPVRFPTAAELVEWGVSVDHFAGATPPPAGAASNEAIVTGTLDWQESLPGWVGKWRMRWHGADHAWGVSGVNYDGAFRDILRGVVLVASGNGSPD